MTFPLALLAPLCLAACPSPSAGQDTRGEIEVNGARSLAISPAGDLWVGSRDGRLYVSRDWNASWKEVDTPARHPDGQFGLGGDQLEHIGFFDDKRAIVSGWIGDEERDEILRTEDGGTTWTLVKLPLPMWVYDAQVMADGHAWLVGSEGKLVGSSDFGATWSLLSAPFDQLRRSSAVCFDSVTTGVVGANIDALKITVDGGRTWTPIQTPVDALIPLDAEEEGDPGTQLVTGPGGKMEFQPLPPGHQDPVERIRMGKGVLLVM